MPNFLDQAYRQTIIGEINSEDNNSRKREHQKRFDVYRERQDRYILERLEREFSVRTVEQMRKILSINLSTRIVDELSSVYSSAPERTFAADGGREITETEDEQLDALYNLTNFNAAMRQANRYYNLHDQCALMIVPDSMGKLKIRAVSPLHYDVVPHPDDPEEAYAYILNVWDLDNQANSAVTNPNTERTQMSRYRSNDNSDEDIADDGDRQKAQERYVVWTPEIHFTMDGHGNYIGDPIPNPIGRLPFIDIAKEKDFQFFVRRGTSVVDFALDIGLLLSDLANIIRLQGYSQAVVSAEELPENFVVGPNNLLFMPLDPARSDIKPTFEFVTPNPDLQGALDFMETTINLFLSSRGIDTNTVSGKAEATSYSSGVERLLAMIDKFEATRSDFDLFKYVETEAFEVMRAWSNLYQDVTENGLREDFLNGKIGEDVYLDIKFSQPGIVETKAEIENRMYLRLEKGLASRKMFLMEVDELSDTNAEAVLKEVDDDEGMPMGDPLVTPPVETGTEPEDIGESDDEDEDDEQSQSK